MLAHSPLMSTNASAHWPSFINIPCINFFFSRNPWLAPRVIGTGADLRGGCKGCAPPPRPTRLSNTTGILQKKTFVVYWCWSKTWDEVGEFMSKRRKNGICTDNVPALIIHSLLPKNSLHTVKGTAANLRKNGPYWRLILEAYQMIDDVRSILKEMRTNIEEEFQDC